MGVGIVKTDVVIVGGGPGGVTAALSMEAQGLSSVIVEKDGFPRFHIGESMTGECGAIVRRLGLEDRMKEHPVKYATDVYGAKGGNKFRVPVMSRALRGELQPSSTWQVRRSDFDSMLLGSATERGIQTVHGTAGAPLVSESGALIGVEVSLEDGSEKRIEAKMVIDASGRATWGYRAGVTGRKKRGHYASQTAAFTHVKGAVRDEGDQRGNTIIFYADRLHWAWFIPIDDDTTSIGVVAPNDYFKSAECGLEEYFEHELRTLNPELARRVTDVVFTEDVQATANFSYEVTDYVKPGYLAVGDAHRFIDPIFSFGLYVTMAEAERAAPAVASFLRDGHMEALNEFMDFAERGQTTLQLLVDAFWANPLAFGYMVHHSQYSEEMIDIFAGRIYDAAPSPARDKLAALVAGSDAK